MPYSNTDLGQHWLRLWPVAWRHQAITRTKFDLSSVRSQDVHLRGISQEIAQSSITKISFKFFYLKFASNLPGANELKENCISNVNEQANGWWTVSVELVHIPGERGFWPIFLVLSNNKDQTAFKPLKQLKGQQPQETGFSGLVIYNLIYCTFSLLYGQ